jgi:septum formation inhibitor-activating ATPase MinD
VARIIVVTSGKGGVGKTTALLSPWLQKGHKTVVIDFDVVCVDLIMGCDAV